MISSLNSDWIDMHYSCQIEGDRIACTITADRDIPAPVFCFSGMAPLTAVEGGTRLRGMGSFTEVALPDLIAGQPHKGILFYIGGYKPANRAWLPLGPYLRVDGQVIELPWDAGGARWHIPAPTGTAKGLPILPQPQGWTPVGGSVAVQGFACDDPAFAAANDLAMRRGWSFAGAFPVRIEKAELAPDAYTIDISQNGVVVCADSYGGRFYAAVTLLMLLQAGPLPLGRIADAPRFGWRGQHLDTARHYYQPQTLFDLLDVMALLKLNRFHWHFADDETFRLEIDSYPELWQKTRFCGEGEMLPALFAGAPHAGGSYSKQVARQIIAHAKALNIEVMPEIEIPGHAVAFTHVFPDTRDPADNGAEVSVQGYQANAINPAMPRTWEILPKLIQEVGTLFPFSHLHLGCDELATDTWMGSPAARALMAQEGLETTADLQGWMMDRLASYAKGIGLRPAAWEEAAKGGNGGIGNGAILFSWTGQGPGLDAARAGYDVVMCPAQNAYLDMAHTNDLDDWGASWAAFVSLEDTVNWTPVPDPALAERIIGVQGTFWSEFTTRDSDLWPMLIPRIFGVAAQAWQKDRITASDLADLSAQHPLLGQMRR